MATPRPARPEDASTLARNLAELARQVLAIANGQTPDLAAIQTAAVQCQALADELDGGWASGSSR